MDDQEPKTKLNSKPEAQIKSETPENAEQFLPYFWAALLVGADLKKAFHLAKMNPARPSGLPDEDDFINWINDRTFFKSYSLRVVDALKNFLGFYDVPGVFMNAFQRETFFRRNPLTRFEKNKVMTWLLLEKRACFLGEEPQKVKAQNGQD